MKTNATRLFFLLFLSPFVSLSPSFFRSMPLPALHPSGRLAAADLRFASPPGVTRSGDGFTISFALSSRSDVEVAVLDAGGSVVRHLAAGVLEAERPPPAPLGTGLAQKIGWDGKDDLGRPAGGGPFKVRVRAGTRARLGGFIGDPAILEEKVFGLATDERGRLFAATGGGYGKNLFTIKVFDRDGKYSRTIMPFPSSLRPEDVAGFGKAEARGGKLLPPQHDALLPWLYPDGLGALMGNQVRGDILWLTDGAGHVCRIRATDGACISWGQGARPAPPAQGPICWAIARDANAGNANAGNAKVPGASAPVVIAPEGWALYLAGWYQGARGVPDGGLFKIDVRTGERTRILSIDVPPDSFWLKEENGWYDFTNWGRKNGLSAIHGVAVDEDGRIYLCDRVHQRLAVHDATGKLLGASPVEHPDQIALSSAGAEIYISTRKIIDGYKAENEIKILKLSGWKDGKVLASLTLQGRNAPSMAADTTAHPAVVWISNVGDGKGITRIEDRGDRFAVTGKLAGDVPEMPSAVVKVWADAFSDDIIVSNGWNGLARFDGPSGRAEEFPLEAIDFAFGPQGEYYLYGQKGWHELVARFGRDFKPLPLAATGKNTTSLTTTGKDVYGRYGHGWSNKGLCVGPDGRVYAYNMYDWAKYFINTWDARGQAEKGSRVGDGLIGPLDPQGGGVALDFQGNVYVGMHGFPKAAAHIGGRPTEGSIVKFGPGGGGYVDAKGTLPGMEWQGSSVGGFLEGALTAYPGLGSQVAGGCVCKEARFDLDGFGRLYIPNALDYHVRVLDNAGNEIVRFGEYGNPDSRGVGGSTGQGDSTVPVGSASRGSSAPGPEVPLGWPFSVSAGRGDQVYVADTLNHRVVRVDLSPSLAAECAVP